jgi:hypothetical protein
VLIEDLLARDPSIYRLLPLDVAKECYLFLRLDKKATRLLGPLYKPLTTRIDLDLTYNCNLKCPCCCRSCSQAPADEFISPSQVEKFIAESIRTNRKWKRIDLIGGEPTIHPDFMEILDLIHSYKMDHSPATAIWLRSNGHGDRYKEIVGKMPLDVIVEHQPKTMDYFRKNYYAFNVAPIDLPTMNRLDPENGCYVTSTCGIALNKYGYYACGNGAGIDRIFGFDLGRKKLPPASDEMRDQMRILCRYCGAFHRCFMRINIGRPADNFAISKSWKTIYEKYRRVHPPLTLY